MVILESWNAVGPACLPSLLSGRGVVAGVNLFCDDQEKGH